MRQSLIEASGGGRASEILAAIDGIGIVLVAAYNDQLEYQRRIDAAFERGLSAVECRKGCSFCCHLKVTATPLEVIRIAATIDTQRHAKVLATAEETAGLDEGQRLARKIPCPLLIEGACSVYPVRPLTCRALLSLSASTCERQFETGNARDNPQVVPSLLTPRLLSASLINGQIAALRDLGLASHPVELVSALAALEREPSLFVRWLSREDVFARA